MFNPFERFTKHQEVPAGDSGTQPDHLREKINHFHHFENEIWDHLAKEALGAAYDDSNSREIFFSTAKNDVEFMEKFYDQTNHYRESVENGVISYDAGSLELVTSNIAEELLASLPKGYQHEPHRDSDDPDQDDRRKNGPYHPEIHPHTVTESPEPTLHHKEERPHETRILT